MRTALLSIGCLVLAVGPAGCGCSGRPEAHSLSGAPLTRPPIEPERARQLEADLETARRACEADPANEDAAIWYGRRLAYLGRYREAIDAFTRALDKHPQSFRLLRHRGHRHVTVRELDEAIADLSRAAALIRGVPDEIEPDGAPNARGIPRSTSHSNIYYHLGLARYLTGDFAGAAREFDRCMEFSRVNDDMLVATSYWLVLARLRSRASAESVLADIRPVMDVIENDDYHRLLLLFKGDLAETQVREAAAGGAVSDATTGYGIGVWKMLQGDPDGARAEFERVVRGPNWAPFGFIAAEAELAR